MHYAGIYATTKLFYENKKCLRVMQGGYNMNIRCNQKLMFYEDRNIDFSVCLFREYAWHLSSVLLGISILPIGPTRKVAQTEILSYTMDIFVYKWLSEKCLVGCHWLIRQIRYKRKENGNLDAKSIFHWIDFGFWCNSKTNECRYVTLYWMIILAFFIHFKIFWTVLNIFSFQFY